MHTAKKVSRWIIKAIGLFMIAVVVLALCSWLSFRVMIFVTKPKTEDLMNYACETYQKEFVLVREYTRTTYMDGEDPRAIKGCPAAELEDPSTGIHFEVYAARPVYDWIIRDDFSHEVLLYCINEQGIPLDEESKNVPCLLLENCREDAIKLQQMTIRYNEIYSVDPSKSLHTWEGFQIPGSLSLYQIEAGYVSDRWFDRTSPFCYDTPLEKYEAFLKETVG